MTEKMQELKPFWSYLGGKWRKSGEYPTPKHGVIIEPFAGAAGYSTRRNSSAQVILIEKDPVIAALWRWLITVSEDELLALPILEPGQNVLDFNLPAPAKTLIGFWLGKGFESPRKRISSYRAASIARTSWWGEAVRMRIASQVKHIRHWNLIEGDYTKAPDTEATWFIDPPYQKAGVMYVESASALDFPSLGTWCKQRKGQVLVCENAGADWLPFESLYKLNGQSNKDSIEAIYIQG